MEMNFFRVFLDENAESCWKFRGKSLCCEYKNENGTPYFHFKTNERGFYLYRSFSGAPETFLDELLNFEIENIPNPLIEGPHFIIYFDSNRKIVVVSKDRIGLFSSIINKERFEISSHYIDGEEIPPGLSVFYENDEKHIAYQSVIPKRITSDLSVDDACNMLQSALVASVVDCPVLFSGGLDSSLLAASLALRGMKRIELINFCADENAPDRISSLESQKDLELAFPNTEFVMVQHLMKSDDLKPYLPTISTLIPPSPKTEMNLNIAMTLYGGIERSRSNLVMTGLGADELFCGYMKMRDETEADDQIAEHMNRLWIRNGGRDDRVAMYLGCFVICPFLSDVFIETAMKIPSSMLVKSELPRGQGEKWILRQLASKLGLASASKRPKQAMQFGSRVAKAAWRGNEPIPES